MSARLLVVDDDEDIRELARLVLTRSGYDVSVAASGEEGLRRAAAEQPDLVLLDVMMPGLDGPATLARLRAEAQTRDIPAVFLTARVSPTDRAELARLDTALIDKPFRPDELSAAVAGLLGEGA